MLTRLLALGFLLVFWVQPPQACAQPSGAASYTTGSVDSGDARLYYMDFGGSGLPLVLVGENWSEIAPSFTDEHRVVALTLHRGSDSTPSGAGRVAARARDLLGFLAGFGFERAVLVSGSYPQEMTFLAEHHPERLAGLVFLAGMPEIVDYHDQDPTGGYQLLLRAVPREVRLEFLGSLEYRPAYIASPGGTIDVPALVFSAQAESAEPPSIILSAGRFLASAPFFTDPEARDFFSRLAADEGLRAEVSAFHTDVVAPRIVAQRDAFRRAFGASLRVETIETPRLTGREYEESPELIAPGLTRFLADVRGESR